MRRQPPQIEISGFPATLIGDASNDLISTAPSLIHSVHENWPNGVLNDEKTGATLLFSGIFLALVGLMLTVMGWLDNDGARILEWARLLGPVLLSVGGTFMLISVCKFGMLSCRRCRQGGEDAAAEAERIPAPRSFAFNGVHQPIVFHCTTVAQLVPQPCGSAARQVNVAREFQPRDSTSTMCGPRNLPPHYYTAYLLDNPAFTAGEDNPPRSNPTADRFQDTEGRVGEKGGEDGTCASPPAYEDIYPSSTQTLNPL